MKRLAFIAPLAIALIPIGLTLQLAVITWAVVKNLRGDHS